MTRPLHRPRTPSEFISSVIRAARSRSPSKAISDLVESARRRTTPGAVSGTARSARDSTDPGDQASDPSGPRPTHDLRLTGPAITVWLTTLALLWATPAIAYTTAGVAALGVGLLAAASHLRPGGERPHGERQLATRAQGERVSAELGSGERAPVGRASGERMLGGRASGEWMLGGWARGEPTLGDRMPGGRALSVWMRRAGVPLSYGGAERARRRRWSVGVGRRLGWAGGITLLVCVAACAIGVGLRLTAVGSGPVRAAARHGESVGLETVVTGDPSVSVKPGRSRETVIVPIRAEMLERTAVRVPVLALASDPAWKAVQPGERLRMTARLNVPRRGELLAAVALVRGPPAVIGRPSAPQRVAENIRAKLRAASAVLPRDQRGVLPGLVDGDTSQLAPDLADAFKTAGLTHLMAVSGENLSLLLGAVLAIGRFTGLGRRAGPLLAAITVVGFVIVARPSPSVLRAAVMGGIALIAIVTGRERQGIPTLSAAVLVLVLADPELARSYGFALSVIATAGILLLAPSWRDRLARRMPRWLAEPLAVSAAAQVACAPLLAMLGGEVSLVAIPANLLAAPAVGPATLLGVFAALIAPLSLGTARVLVYPAGLAVGWITGVARTAAGLPGAAIAWQAGLVGGLLLIAALAAGTLVLRRRGPRRIAAAITAGAVAVMIAGHFLAPGWPPAGWRFTVCDVGQGDGLALYAGPGRAVVVDTGPDPRLMDRCLRDLRVTAIPLLVLTHPHADHIDGIPGALHDRTVGTVVISPDSEGEERRFLPGRQVRTAATGDTWTVGPVTLTVLGPLTTERVSTRDPGTEVNNASIVMLAHWRGLTVLLPGDAEIEAQQEILAAGLPPADVLKVPHHGSANQDPDFLAATHAHIAITSVGAGNDYGHPAPKTMTRLTNLGMHTYRTDQNGDTTVITTPQGPAAVPRH